MPIVERTTVNIREEIALMAMDKRYSVSEVALKYGVSRPTVRLWRERYRKSGRSGLTDLSHAPQDCPHRMSDELEELILAERRRFGWGSKKILRRLADDHPKLDLPGRSAIDALLRRQGLVQVRTRRSATVASPFQHRYQATHSGELMTIDHKGQFLMGNGKYCYALTIVDNVSRYLLACVGLSSTRLSEAWPVITRVFRAQGLPVAMQSDNGPPFGSPVGGLSTMSVRLMMLGVRPVFGRPAHPQDNGRHERMHLDLKADTTRPPGQNLVIQQKKFDAFVHRYNVDRPHEGIGMQRPANVFTPSPRPYPRVQRRAEYAGHFETRIVSDGGDIKLNGRRIFLAKALQGQVIGLEEIDERLFNVHFFSFNIGKIDESKALFI